ncbi:thioredoxin family protein [Haloferacaceae archaeon DSL9]
MNTAPDSETPQKPLRLDDGDDLDRVLAEHDFVLVEFYTKGCTLCQAIEPVLGNVARATDVTVAMVNPGTDLSLVETYAVKSVPTLVLFENGIERGRLTDGFQGADEILAFIDEHTDARVEARMR